MNLKTAEEFLKETQLSFDDAAAKDSKEEVKGRKEPEFRKIEPVYLRKMSAIYSKPELIEMFGMSKSSIDKYVNEECTECNMTLEVAAKWYWLHNHGPKPTPEKEVVVMVKIPATEAPPIIKALRKRDIEPSILA